jgi:hypothetical protein
MVTHEISFICAICGESVAVIACVTDEFGKPVHEQCYAEKLACEKKLPRSSHSEQPPPKAAA